MTTETNSPLLKEAIRIATETIAKEKQPGTEPYAESSLRVMARMQSDDDRIVAVLNGLAGGPNLPSAKLKESGFPPHILAALDCVRQRWEQNEEDEEFIRRCIANPIALRVAIAECQDYIAFAGSPDTIMDSDDRFAMYVGSEARLDALTSAAGLPRLGTLPRPAVEPRPPLDSLPVFGPGCDLYVGYADDPKFHWDGGSYSGNIPTLISRLDTMGVFRCAAAQELLTTAGFGGRQLDWGACGARLTRQRIIEFIRELYREPTAAEVIVSRAMALDPNRLYVLVACET